MAEGVTVSGQSPLLDTTTALKQTVISREVSRRCPNRTDVWSVARVIPGVVLSKVDVGGSEAFLQSTRHGAGQQQRERVPRSTAWTFVNGRQRTVADHVLDPYAFQETNYRWAAAARPSPNGGLTFNMVTRTGTNQLHGGAMYNGRGQLMESENYSDDTEAAAARRPCRRRRSRPTRISCPTRTSEIHLRCRGLDGRARSCATNCGSPSPGMTSDSNQYMLGSYNPRRHAGARRQHHVDHLGQGGVADDARAPAVVLQQPPVQAASAIETAAARSPTARRGISTTSIRTCTK